MSMTLQQRPVPAANGWQDVDAHPIQLLSYHRIVFANGSAITKTLGFCVVFLVMRLRGHDCIYGTSGLLAAQWDFGIDGRTNVEHIIWSIYIYR